MSQTSSDELKLAVELQHGGTATLVHSGQVLIANRRKLKWRGIVAIFDLKGTPSGATRAYAWSAAMEGSSKLRYFAVLHSDFVADSESAVELAIALEGRGVQVGFTAKTIRKLRRKESNRALSKEARFWKGGKSAIQLGYTRPVNRQAANELSRSGKK